ncbi:TetR/AcrR family transcriptional regulator [Cupriavidus oxalaticus]|uniref:TetR/AcrR family transcriptional regulator n=1 Tax=Cupriavidus oxalaticus TaxID=96344 RepID=UPI00316B3DBC
MQDGTKLTARAGRPRKFDENDALKKMQRQIWTTGLSGASLEAIARSAGLNRPSLATSFGSKDEIYAQAAVQYATMMEARIGQALDCEDLKTALTKSFDVALDIFTSDGPNGCFVICTAPAEALTCPVCQSILSQSLDSMDALFLRRLERERKTEQSEVIDLPAIASQLGATLQSLALRVRAGWTRDRLKRFVTGSVTQVIMAMGERQGSDKPV